METKRFEFYVDQKYTSWERGFFRVDAVTREEALKVVKELFEADEISPYDWDQIGDTERVSVFENDGCATREVYEDDSHDVLIDNAGLDNISGQLKPTVKERVKFAKDT